MSLTETNPFIVYIPKKAHKLILGSFPCFNGSDYGDFFYSGSGRNFFWPILSQLTGMPVQNAREKKALCSRHCLALSDIALQIVRTKNNCSDSNLRVLEHNYKGVERGLSAGVNHVFFTSRFVQSHFQKMFPGITIRQTLLPSPSPAANRHIGSLADYREAINKGKVSGVFEYRLEMYRKLLFGKK